MSRCFRGCRLNFDEFIVFEAVAVEIITVFLRAEIHAVVFHHGRLLLWKISLKHHKTEYQLLTESQTSKTQQNWPQGSYPIPNSMRALMNKEETQNLASLPSASSAKQWN